MSQRKHFRFILLILVMSTVAVLVLSLTVLALFLSTSLQHKRVLMSYAEHQASMLHSVLELVPPAERNTIEPPALVLGHINQVLGRNPVITSSGEISFAWREGANIHYAAPPRFNKDIALIVPNDKHTIKAMRLALNGQSGVIETRDYRNVPVMAAYVPVEGMNLGIVVKIDIAELRQPFIRTILWAGLATLILIVLGTLLMQKLSRPLIQNLEESETKYRTLFESANEGIMVIGDYIEECNDQVLQLLGYDKTELIGLSIADLAAERQPHDDLPANAASTRFALAQQGKPQFFLWRSIRKDGSDIDLDVMLKSVSVGERTFVLATLLDITDRRRAELELRKAEKEVADAREHLAHMARLSTMGEMAAGIAHEINQPLTAITTYAQGCRRLLDKKTQVSDSTAADENCMNELAEPLDKIVTQALRAGEVIRRLRSFIKKSTSELELIDVNQLVRDVVKLAEVDARKYDIPVYLFLAPSLPRVCIDAVQLQQVILNLIRNALEATENIPHKNARVEVRTAQESTGQISIKVIDCGHGLSKDAMQHVFAPFFTTKATGMGMGLSISHSIITAHGGQLAACNNTSGQGATFTVLLNTQSTRA